MSRLAGSAFVLSVGLGLAACGSSPVEVRTQAAAAAGWRALAEAPLSPRADPVAAWTGTEAVFLGGQVGDFCPPNASCEGPAKLAADGAAYDPATDTWRRVADAPVPLAGWMRSAVVGDEVFVVDEKGALRSLDVSADRWTDHGTVPKAARYSTPTPTGDGRLVLAVEGGGRDRVYDPAKRTWADLPAAPADLGASRSYVATPAGLVAFGSVPNGRPDRPDLVDAAVLDLAAGTWRELPTSEQLGTGFQWTGTRLVAAQLGGADGGEVNGWGRRYPEGGTLDPVAGTWGALPNAPKNYDGRNWTVNAAGGRWSVTGGWLYDDVEESWTRLSRPDGASDAGAGAAVWAGDRLLAFGGVPDFAAGRPGGLSSRLWGYGLGSEPENASAEAFPAIAPASGRRCPRRRCRRGCTRSRCGPGRRRCSSAVR